MNPPSSHVCESCGATIGQVEPTHDSSEHALAEARREAANLRQSIARLRALYWLGAGWIVVQILMLWLSLRETPGWSEGEDAGATKMFFAALVAVLVVSIAGALYLKRAPVIWASVLAVMQTVSLALEIEYGGGHMLQPLCQAAFVVAYWVAIAFAISLHKRMAAHPDYAIEPKPIDEKRRVHGGIGDHLRHKAEVEHAQGAHTMHVVAGVAGGGLIAVALLVWAVSRPLSPKAIATPFQEVWNATGSESFANLFPGGIRNATLDVFFGGLERRGWMERRSPIKPESFEPTDDNLIVTYAGLSQPLRVQFRRNNEGWKIRGVELPNATTDAASFAATRFERAWNDAGTNPLFALMTAGYRKKNGDSFNSRLKVRDWLGRRPPISDAETDFDEVTASGVCKWKLADGELMVSFEWWHPNWMVTGVRFPPRPKKKAKSSKRSAGAKR